MEINQSILLNSYFNEALENLLKVLKIPSETGTPTKKAIFGKSTREVLEFTLNIAKRWKVKTYIDPKGYYGYLEYGKGENVLLITPHLDVVTPGNLDFWDSNPYEPVIKEEKIFARGALDNKGPSYMVLYAMKYLIDEGYQPNNFVIRVVFGLDEEKEMRCLKKYLEDHGAPTIGFTPDSGFPCTYAEKGMADIDLKGEFKADFSIRKAVPSKDYNVAIDHVVYNGPKKLEIQFFLIKNEIFCEIVDNELHVYGKEVHASIPELGANAALWILKALESVGIKHPLVQFSGKYLFNKYDLFDIVGDISDESGKLSTCIGQISVDNDKFKLGINIRIPVTKLIQKDVLADFEKLAKKHGIITQVKNSFAPVYYRQDQIIVEKIINVYRKVTNEDNLKPMITGISTYAKIIPNLIACGLTTEEEGALSPHYYNEWVKIDNLKKGLLIYTNLIVELTK